MSRCIICNYSRTTKTNEKVRAVFFNEEDQCWYCTDCKTAVDQTLKDYDPILEKEEE